MATKETEDKQVKDCKALWAELVDRVIKTQNVANYNKEMYMKVLNSRIRHKRY